MKKITSLLVIVFLFNTYTSAQNIVNHTYPNTDGPDKNPLKGWNSGWWDNFDLSTVGFQYLKWKDFEPTDGNFDFNAVEDVISRPGSAEKHIILRLYTDWFGNDQTSDAGPQWLYNTYGVQRLQAPNGKYITDFNDPNYITQVTQAIEALANEYNNDERIYIIQLGVLGYWGEWHTYSYNDDDFDIAETTKTQILEVFKSNFSNKEIMGRYPWREPLASENTIGYHNDFFVPNNGHSDEFDDTVSAGNKWLGGPIGGEVPPIDNSEQFMSDLYETATGMNMIETGHYSTMKIGSDERPCQSNPNGQKCQGFMAMHRKMGYNYQIESALFAETLSQSDNLSVDLNILNIGVAPMYYDWDVQFALLDDTNQTIETFDVTYDLKALLPSTDAYTISLSEAINTIPEGSYKLGLRFIQPNADVDKTNPWQLDVRNTYILFSNELPSIDGQWDANNALTGGWSILGTVSIDNASLNIDNLISDDSLYIYPNPSKAVLNIQKNATTELNILEMYDISARLIKTIDLKDMQETKALDISNLANGIYNLVIYTDHGKINRRFIKY